VKHKARNNGGNRSLVTSNGGGEHGNRDRAESPMLDLREYQVSGEPFQKFMNPKVEYKG